MHEVKAKVQPKKHSCCPEKSLGAQEEPEKPAASCNCRIQAPDEPAQTPGKLVAPTLWFIMVPQSPGVVSEVTITTVATDEILFCSDSSPPTVTRHPDLGRAPPAA